MSLGFRDEEQRLRACRTLLAVGGVDGMWDHRGPTHAARAALTEHGIALAPGVRALVLAAWAFWTGEPIPLRLDEVLGLPEAEPILKLAIAAVYGPDAIDAWLARPDGEGFVSGDDARVHAAAARLFDEARATLAEHGGLPMNMAAAPDACALGVLHMADYAMMVGMPIVDDDDDRHARARRIAVEVLGMFATLSHRRGAPLGGDAKC